MTQVTQPLRVTAAADLAEGGLARWSCGRCAKPVDDFRANQALQQQRPEARLWDYWAACSNPECSRVYGSGYHQSQPLWVKVP